MKATDFGDVYFPAHAQIFAFGPGKSLTHVPGAWKVGNKLDHVGVAIDLTGSSASWQGADVQSTRFRLCWRKANVTDADWKAAASTYLDTALQRSQAGKGVLNLVFDFHSKFAYEWQLWGKKKDTNEPRIAAAVAAAASTTAVDEKDAAAPTWHDVCVDEEEHATTDWNWTEKYGEIVVANIQPIVQPCTTLDTKTLTTYSLKPLRTSAGITSTGADGAKFDVTVCRTGTGR
jgi:hypothetical protein